MRVDKEDCIVQIDRQIAWRRIEEEWNLWRQPPGVRQKYPPKLQTKMKKIDGEKIRTDDAESKLVLALSIFSAFAHDTTLVVYLHFFAKIIDLLGLKLDIAPIPLQKSVQNYLDSFQILQHLGYKHSLFQAQRICAETTTKLSLLAENWKYLLGGLICQASRALRDLKGVVRIQALVRGRQVRKQAAVTLRCMQVVVRVQARVRARRVCMSMEGQVVQDMLNERRSNVELLKEAEEGWCDSRGTLQEVKSKIQVR